MKTVMESFSSRLMCGLIACLHDFNSTPFGFKLLFVLFLIAPFALPIDHFVFQNKSVFGMSVPNLMMLALLAVCTVSAVGYRKKDAKPYLYATMILIFATIANTLFYGVTDCAIWLSNHEYYFTVPLVLFCLTIYNDYIEVLIRQALVLSVPICLVALALFITDDYFGMVSYETMLQYDVVGMPFSRMMAVFASPNVAGTYFASILYMDLHYVHGSPALRGTRRFLLGLCLFLSFSRTAIFASLLCIGFEYYLKTNNRGKHFKRPKPRSTISVLVGILACILLMLAISALLAKSGLYFFNFMSPEFFQNARIEKWFSFLRYGLGSWLVGEPLNSSFEYAGVSLSDNSFLLTIASFGLIAAVGYWWSLAMGIKGNVQSIRNMVPVCTMLTVFLMLADFIQFFPVAYYMSMLLVFMASVGKKSQAEDLGRLKWKKF